MFYVSDYIDTLVSKGALETFPSVVQDIPGSIKSHLTKIIFENLPHHPRDLMMII